MLRLRVIRNEYKKSDSFRTGNLPWSQILHHTLAFWLLITDASQVQNCGVRGSWLRAEVHAMNFCGPRGTLLTIRKVHHGGISHKVFPKSPDHYSPCFPAKSLIPWKSRCALCRKGWPCRPQFHQQQLQATEQLLPKLLSGRNEKTINRTNYLSWVDFRWFSMKSGGRQRPLQWQWWQASHRMGLF